MVGVAVGRSGDELVGEVEASQRVRRQHLERVTQSKIREVGPGHALRDGLTYAWRAMEKHVVSTGSGYLAGPHGRGLTDHWAAASSSKAQVDRRPSSLGRPEQDRI